LRRLDRRDTSDAMRIVLALLLCACGHHGPGDSFGQSDGGAHDDDGGGDRDASNRDGGSSGHDGGVLDGGLAHDGGTQFMDAATSTHPLTEIGMVSCWSVGGFQAVYHDQPAHIGVALYDGDGIGDIDTTADVVIPGHYNALYDVGPRPLISLGDSGCCNTTVKVPINYDDFKAAGQAVGGPDTEFWSASATFRDHAGNTIVARCDDEWFLEDAYYGD
jgi:hypothetical protein